MLLFTKKRLQVRNTGYQKHSLIPQNCWVSPPRQRVTRLCISLATGERCPFATTRHSPGCRPHSQGNQQRRKKTKVRRSLPRGNVSVQRTVPAHPSSESPRFSLIQNPASNNRKLCINPKKAAKIMAMPQASRSSPCLDLSGWRSRIWHSQISAQMNSAMGQTGGNQANGRAILKCLFMSQKTPNRYSTYL